VDEAYKDQDAWLEKCITSVARMGFFSSDRCIQEYADEIWSVEPLPPNQEKWVGVIRAKGKLEYANGMRHMSIEYEVMELNKIKE